MITTDSRYRNVVIQTVQGPDGPRREMAIPFPVSKLIQYTYYITKGGDRVDTLAARYYSNANLWWVISNSNPEILDYMDLTPGTVIRIPSV